MNPENHTVPSAASGTQIARQYRPCLSFYHPNGRGTGCAVRMELLPAQGNDEGAIMLSAANQLTIGDRRAQNPTFPRFDWEGKIVVKLNFSDLCKFLQVFRGECETIDEGHGLYHRSARGTTKIVLRHVIEPMPGYSLELYKNTANGDEGTRAHILFSASEALGICEAISGAMYLISFGVPMVSGAQGGAEQSRRDCRHASAA